MEMSSQKTAHSEEPMFQIPEEIANDIPIEHLDFTLSKKLGEGGQGEVKTA